MRPCIIVATCETRSSGTGTGPGPLPFSMVLGNGTYYLQRITFSDFTGKIGVFNNIYFVTSTF